MADDADAYNRGVEQGRVEQTLLEHAEHLAKINGSMEKVALQLHALTLAVQRLADQRDADAATAVATAHALAKDEAARRARDESRWWPWGRLIAVVGAATGVAAIVVAVWLSTR